MWDQEDPLREDPRPQQINLGRFHGRLGAVDDDIIRLDAIIPHIVPKDAEHCVEVWSEVAQLIEAELKRHQIEGVAEDPRAAGNQISFQITGTHFAEGPASGGEMLIAVHDTLNELVKRTKGIKSFKEGLAVIREMRVEEELRHERGEDDGVEPDSQATAHTVSKPLRDVHLTTLQRIVDAALPEGLERTEKNHISCTVVADVVEEFSNGLDPAAEDNFTHVLHALQTAVNAHADMLAKVIPLDDPKAAKKREAIAYAAAGEFKAELIGAHIVR